MGRIKTLTGLGFLGLAFFASAIFSIASAAVELPPLNGVINDFARMMPEASLRDLEQRLHRFKTQRGDSVVVLTISSLEDETIESFGQRAFKNLPFDRDTLRKTVLLLIARKQQKVGVQIGQDLQHLFPEPEASRRLQAHVEIYFSGLRPDLGIHSGVNYVFRLIRGEVHVAAPTEVEKLEDASTQGAEAGAIFALFLAPYLAFWAGVLWGIYATTLGLPRVMRLFMGAILSGGMAKVVATLMAMLGSYGYDLWYFILAASLILGVFGSLTEFWMSGDWCAIPRLKGKVKRKPEDNMGI